MKKFVSILFVLLITVAISFSGAFAANVYQIDNFEDMDFENDVAKTPTWFTFGESVQEVKLVSETEKNKYSTNAGTRYLHIKGTTEKYYIGGIGKAMNKDISKYTHIKAMVYGTGKKKGKFLIELYDDDNGNDKIEMNDKYEALEDDKWAFEMNVDWKGWRVITIPLTDFSDKNPNVGDNVFNPVQLDGSKGLINFQLIFLSQDKKGVCDFGIDEIKFIDANGEVEKLEVDNFEDGNLKYSVEEKSSWWTFGELEYAIKAGPANDPLNKYTGKGVLFLNGKTSGWYVGGFGKYLAIDGTKYSKLKMMVLGNGKDSGVINIEMYDDDNNSYEMEQDDSFKPIYDDKWTKSINVNWKGWKVITIPFTKFKDSNKRVGDNKLNLNQEDGSGGLLHFQLIVNASKKIGTAKLAIDNIKLVE